MKAVITYWPTLTTTQGARKMLDWEGVFGSLERSPGTFRGDLHPGWSAAAFDGNKRLLANVQQVFAMVLDYDGTQSLDAAEQQLADYYGLLHTSKRHTQDVHRYRAVLPLTRPVSRFEFEAMWRRLNARWPGILDPQAKDASRFWYMPGLVDGASFETRRLNGEPMSPEALLAEPEPQQKQQQRTDWRPTADAEKRASAYLDKMPPAIAGSEGHSTTFRAAIAMAQGFGLGESSVWSLMWNEYNPRCQPPWSERDLRHKVDDACNKARVPSGYIVENDDMPPEYYASTRYVEPAEEPTEQPTEQAPPQEEPGRSACERHGVATIAEMLQDVYEGAKAGTPPPSVSTGSVAIDRLLGGGFRRGNVTFLGAQTNWGKSSFCVMVLDEAVARGDRVLLVSGEDSRQTYGQRIAARRGRFNASQLRVSDLTDDERERLLNIAADGEKAPSFLHGIGKPAEQLARAVVELCGEEDYDLVIVDYLQALTCLRKSQDRRNEVTHIARCFVDAIKTVGASGLIVSQLKRLESGKTPGMHDLKESGDLENMAEHILIGASTIGVNRVTNKVDERRFLHVAKNKDGPKSAEGVFMPFDPNRACFVTERERS